LNDFMYAPHVFLPSELLQAKLLSGRQEGDAFADALVAGFGALGSVDPAHHEAAVTGGELPEEGPGFGVGLEGFGDVGRKRGY
jgi:hypothetical protein